MRALVVVHNPTWFTELSQLGFALHRSGRHTVAFHVADLQHESMHDIARTLRVGGIPCDLEVDRPRSTETRILRAASRAFRGTLRDLLDETAAQRRALEIVRDLVREHRPDVAVLGGDMPGYSTAGFIRGFHAARVPSVLVPSTMSNGLEQAEVYGSDPRHHVSGLAARSAARFFPRWTREHRGRTLLRSTPGRVFAMEALRVAPPKPWVFNSGHADAIAMESIAMVDYYAEAGLPRDAMVLTGSPSDDAMAASLAAAPRLRRELLSELGLPPEKPILLTALVPDFLYVTGGRPECDFRTYDELVEMWISALAAQQTFNVVIALHPSVKPETMRRLERPGVRIAARRTADLVPLCDLYVASISSTIRWAIACGKPVVNYDVYRYRYTDFLGVPGIAATESAAEFRAIIARLASDPAELADLRRKQEPVASRWGTLDGGATRRIIDLLESVSQSQGTSVRTGRSAA